MGGRYNRKGCCSFPTPVVQAFHHVEYRRRTEAVLMLVTTPDIHMHAVPTGQKWQLVDIANQRALKLTAEAILGPPIIAANIRMLVPLMS